MLSPEKKGAPEQENQFTGQCRDGPAWLRVSAQKHNQTIKSGNSKKNQKNNQNR